MIRITNFRDNDVVSYPLILLKGQLLDSREVNEIFVECNGTYCLQWPVFKKQFKAFVHLNQVVNVIKISLGEKDGSSIDLRVRYEQSQQSMNNNFLRLVYVVCKDESGGIYDDGRFQGPPEEDCSLLAALEKISFIALLVQCFYSSTLPDGQGFSLELGDDIYPKVYTYVIPKTSEELWQLNGEELWNTVATKLLSSSLADDKCKYLAFCSFTRLKKASSKTNPPAKGLENVKGYVALGGGGLALLGSHGFFCWPKDLSEITPKFTDSSPIDSSKYFDESGNRGTKWGCCAATIGACIHELGHTLGLGHANRGIMARDFYKIHKFFTLSEKHSDVLESSWWDRSSYLILSHNRWFKSLKEEKSAFVLENDRLMSKNGVILIEYRDASSLILKYSEYQQAPKTIKLTNAIPNYDHIVAVDNQVSSTAHTYFPTPFVVVIKYLLAKQFLARAKPDRV